MIHILSGFVLGNLANEIPKKCNYKVRIENKGKTIFNQDTLGTVYIDNIGFSIFEKVDGKTSVREILGLVRNERKIPLFILSCICIKYFKYLHTEKFIHLDNPIDIPIKNMYKNLPILSAPNQVSWIITNQCNLNCSHCANKTHTKLNHELTTKEAIEFVETCAREGVFLLNISGGEPFIRKDLFIILKKARNLGLEVGITTNGTLISEEIAKRLKRIDPFNVHISFDGIGEIHDQFRNKRGVYLKVLNSIKFFKKHSIPFGLTTSISKTNMHNMDKIMDFVKVQKIRSWEVYYAIPVGNLAKEQALSSNEFVDLARKISAYKDTLSGECDIFVGDSLGYFCSYNIRDQEWTGCLAGINHCAIGPEGEIKGCPIQPDKFIEGDIRNDDFIEVWRNSNSFGYNRNLLILENHCKKCGFSKLCRGGCKTSMFAQHGKMTYNNLCVRQIESEKSS